MKRYLLHKSAESEWSEAADYYETCSPGLGRAFVESIDSALNRIAETPQAFPCYKQTRARKCVVSRFPYVIFFVELANETWVLAIAHAKRRPEYWKNRWSAEP